MIKKLFIFSLFFFPLLARPEILHLESIGPHFNTLDLDMDFGIPIENEKKLNYTRLRVGKMWVVGNHIQAIGLSAGTFSFFNLGIGIEGEFLNTESGLWIQGNVLTSQKENLLTGISVGWSLLGFELLTSPLNFKEKCYLVKLRIPLGILLQLT